MGDKNRGKLFTNLILKNFPNATNILSIADGNFIVANNLCEYDKNIIVFDPKIRARKKNKNIIAVKKEFYSNENIKTDLITGMHPDEATGQIIDFAIKNKKDFILCPYCIKGKYSNKNINKKSWIKRLKGIAENNRFIVSIIYLKMSGDNIVIIGKYIK